jgi:predicted Zn-ribbon and HTH transcriptional regulator
VLFADAAFSAVRGFRRERAAQSEPGQCRNCGYNLTGNVSGICPECGTAVAARKQSR